MTKRIAFHIFLWGTLFSAVLFLWLTWDTHHQVAALSHADTLSAEVIAGKRAFEKYNCNDCHTILGFGGYYAPDLTKVVKRLGAEGVRYRIQSPDKAFAASPRKMPVQGISVAELDHLVAFFSWVGEIDNGDWPPQDSPARLSRAALRLTAGAGLSPGAAVFQTKGCMNCHALHGAGGDTGRVWILTTQANWQVVGDIDEQPECYATLECYPNPFNERISIKFVVKSNGLANFSIFNIAGQKVAELFDGMANANQVNNLTFNASDLSSGIYFARLTTPEGLKNRKLVYLK